jgi:energy-coupling factor transport system permease protein
MKSLALGRYVPYSTFIHKLDPRLKLIGMVMLMILIFLKFSNIQTNLLMYGVLFLGILLLLNMAHIQFRQLFRQLKALWVMMTFLLVVNILFPFPVNPQWFFRIGGLTIYVDSLIQTFYIIVRLVLMIALTSILTTSTKPLDLTYAIEWFLGPLKVIKFPAHEVAMTIAIALRFIPTLLDEAMRIMNAQASRGVDFVHGKMSEKVRAIISLIVPLFISSFQRSEELANAMEARGYNPSAPRTRYRILVWNKKDGYALVILLLLTTMFIYLQGTGFNIVEIYESL